MNDKKDAIDVAISEIIGIIDNSDPIYCPLKSKCSKKDCYQCDKEKFRKMFEEEADIPDGWDVVKNIYKCLLTDYSEAKEKISHYKLMEKMNDEDTPFSSIVDIKINKVVWSERKDTYERYINHINKKLQQAGIEVE